MGYDEGKDKLVKLFELEDGNGAALLVSLMSYGGAEAKMQVTRSFKKADNTMGYGKMGRLTRKEVSWLKDNIDEILELMEKE